MIKKIRHNLLFNFVTSCFLLFLTISPCLCAPQNNSDLSSAAQSTSGGDHDCCDENSNNDNKAKTDCDSCDSCVAVVKDFINGFSHLHNMGGLDHASNLNVIFPYHIDFLRKTSNKYYVKLLLFDHPETFLIKSSSSLSQLYNRWII